MEHCCNAEDLHALTRRAGQRKVLQIVLVVNAVLFVVELVAGIRAGSTALLGDSLDMLGDAFVYGFTLFVLERSERDRTYAAFAKGVIMAVFGIYVVWEAVAKMLAPSLPAASVMSGIGLLALAGNGFCFWLLYRYRSDDLNMRSTWLCSRNDLFANASVIVAALLVTATQTIWPDVVVGLAIAALFLRTAADVLRESALHLRTLGQSVGGGGVTAATRPTRTRVESDRITAARPS